MFTIIFTLTDSIHNNLKNRVLFPHCEHNLLQGVVDIFQLFGHRFVTAPMSVFRDYRDWFGFILRIHTASSGSQGFQKEPCWSFPEIRTLTAIPYRCLVRRRLHPYAQTLPLGSTFSKVILISSPALNPSCAGTMTARLPGP